MSVRMRFTLCAVTVSLLLASGLASADWFHSSAGAKPTHRSEFFGDRFVGALADFGAVLGRAPAGLSKFSPTLQATLADEGKTTFLVVLREQADLSAVTALPTKEARGRAVYDTLRAVARRAQASLRTELDAKGIQYRSFYVVNMLAVQGDAALAQALAARPEVARLEANPAVRLTHPPPELNQGAAPTDRMKRWHSSILPTGDGILPQALSLAPHDTPQATTAPWGVRRIGADRVWALGYTGQGIVVAGQDTGYDWDHPALQTQYRGWDGITVNHDYNWHDAIHSGGGVCGADSPEPCDDNSHGTHTMGTMVGDDGGTNQIGVAPGARWIGCRNMDRGVGTPTTYAECFEFFLAPYPLGGDPMTDGDPGLAPHVVNNSWSCPVSEGCDEESLRTIVENVRAAGIVVVASAGNRGPSCETINTPPGLHDASFSIGATNISDQITAFSGRGPVTIDGSNRLKPDVSAPGDDVRSSLPGGYYGYKDGTSMAAPHVSGLVALLWSAAPYLVGQVEVTEELIQNSARPVIDSSCDGDIDGHPNNVYGWGIVDALAAVEEAMISRRFFLPTVFKTWP